MIKREQEPNLGVCFDEVSGFLLRFEVAGTTVSIAGTKDGSRATIFARSAKLG